MRKLKLYDEFNVPEYWIVDPERNVTNLYRRQNAGLTLVEKVRIGGAITSPLLPGFSLQVRGVFA